MLIVQNVGLKHVTASLGMIKMIDRDMYYPNEFVEEFLESLKSKLKKDHSPIIVYISTSNPYDHWLKKLTIQN
jgi:hypothetical protein